MEIREHDTQKIQRFNVRRPVKASILQQRPGQNTADKTFASCTAAHRLKLLGGISATASPGLLTWQPVRYQWHRF